MIYPKTSVLITMVPIVSELIMLKTPYYGHYEDNQSLYKEVMTKSEELKKAKAAQQNKKE